MRVVIESKGVGLAAASVRRRASTSSIYATLPLETCLRDIQTLTQHHSVAPHNYEIAGQPFLGFDLAGGLRDGAIAVMPCRGSDDPGEWAAASRP